MSLQKKKTSKFSCLRKRTASQAKERVEGNKKRSVSSGTLEEANCYICAAKGKGTFVSENEEKKGGRKRRLKEDLGERSLAWKESGTCLAAWPSRKGSERKTVRGKKKKVARVAKKNRLPDLLSAQGKRETLVTFTKGRGRNIFGQRKRGGKERGSGKRTRDASWHL